MGGGSSKDEEWVRGKHEDILALIGPQFVRGEGKYASHELTTGTRTLLVQLLRLSVAHSAITNPSLRHISEVKGLQYFFDALKISFPIDNRGSSCWVKSYYTALLVSGKNRFRVCIVLDQTSLMIFSADTSIMACCKPKSQTVLAGLNRISLLHVVNVSAASANTLELSIAIQGSAERKISFFMNDPNEIARDILDLISVVTHGAPPEHRLLRSNQTGGYDRLGHLTEMAQMNIQRDGGFHQTFLTFLLQTAGLSSLPIYIPKEWLASQPPYIHSYRCFQLAKYGARGLLPRIDTLLYEMEERYSYISDATYSNDTKKWSDIADTQYLNNIVSNPDSRLTSNVPVTMLPGLVEAVGGELVPAGSRVINILSLHGSAYAASTNFKLNPVSSGIVIDTIYGSLAGNGIVCGGFLWHYYSKNRMPVLCNPEIAVSAIMALRFNSQFIALSFDGCELPTFSDQSRVLLALSELCRWNPIIESLQFPPVSNMATDNVGSNWKTVGLAIAGNPRPLFGSLDFRGCRLGDQGVIDLSPGLIHLYGTLRIPPLRIRMDKNFLSRVGASKLCQIVCGAPLVWLQEFSLGGNPWLPSSDSTSSPDNPITWVLSIISVAPNLKILNVESSSKFHFPLDALYRALFASPCPLTDLSVAGCAVERYIEPAFVQNLIAIIQLKARTLQRVGLRDAMLSSDYAYMILNSVSHIHVDMTNAVGSDKPTISASGVRNCFDVNSAIAGINLFNISPQFLYSFTAIPRNLVVLDISTEQQTPQIRTPWRELAFAFQCSYPIALRIFSCARQLAAADNFFVTLLHNLLMNLANIHLTHLDITGCCGGNVALCAIGIMLRKNRSLTNFQFDGQNADVEGWAALRGCFYGNKKILELSYPWADVNFWFSRTSTSITKGIGDAGRIKFQIGQAHRSNNMRMKFKYIEDIKGCKIAYKRLARKQMTAARLLCEIFDSVNLNSKLHNDQSIAKMSSKRSSAPNVQYRATVALKMKKNYEKLQVHLTKLYLLKSNDPSVSLGIWAALVAAIREGAYLYRESTFVQFSSYVRRVNSDANSDIVNIVNEMEALIEAMEVKASQVGEGLDDFLSDVARENSTLFEDLLTYEIPKEVGRIKSEVGRKKSDYGDGGGGGEDGAHRRTEVIDTSDAVHMYAGAGPRDLPDGGDPGGSIGGSSTRPKLKKICVGFKYQGRKTVQPISIRDHFNENWRNAVKTAVSATSDILIKVLSYESKVSAITTADNEWLLKWPSCVLVTQCSADRLHRLEVQARAWNGPVSAAIYIPTDDRQESVIRAVQDLVARLNTETSYEGKLVCSFLYGHEDKPWLWDDTEPGGTEGPLYPINNLRNVAVAAGRSAFHCTNAVSSPLLFLVDVDFVPSKGLLEWVRSNLFDTDGSRGLISRCSDGELLVVPAFEITSAERCETVPETYLTFDGIEKAFREDAVSSFHTKYFAMGHAPTDYGRWFSVNANKSASLSDSYPVSYQEYYEPYVIMSSERFVPYDERFRGYGMNKCIHLKTLASRGCTFRVIPSHFVVAGVHERSVAHKQTYGSESGYRKFVVAASYDLACKEISNGKMPLISRKSEQLWTKMKQDIDLRDILKSKSSSVPSISKDFGGCFPGAQLYKEKLFDAVYSIRSASELKHF